MTEDRAAPRVVVYLGDIDVASTTSLGLAGHALEVARALSSAPEWGVTLVAGLDTELGDGLDHVVRLDFRSTSARGRLLRGPRLACEYARTVRADVLLFPRGLGPLLHRSEPVRTAVWIHDDIPWAYARGELRASLKQRWKAVLYSRLLRWSHRRADIGLTSSEFSRQRLQRVLRDTPSLTVVGATSPILGSPAGDPSGSRHKHICFIPSGIPHKRADLAAAVAAELAHEFGAGWSSGAIGGDPMVTSEELSHELAASSLLVFPSTYEGFGLPPLEAFSLGTPCLTQRSPAALEVLAGLPGVVEFDDADDLARVARRLVSADDEDRRAWSTTALQRGGSAHVARQLMATLTSRLEGRKR